MKPLVFTNKVTRYCMLIIFFCGLLSTVFGAKDSFPAIPKFSGCCAKPVVLVNTNHKSKIITLSPAITEIVYALGAGDDIIAVSDFSDYPPEAKTKPKVGGFINPSFEKILVSKPDIIIYQGEMPKIKKFCKNYKIPTCNVQVDNWTTITNAIQQIGNKIGREKPAGKLRNQMTVKWNCITDLAVEKKPVPVFVCIGRESGPVASCTTIGKNSFINEALTIAGGSNICEDVLGSYPTVSAEVIASRQPEIIFEFHPGQTVNEAKLVKEWGELCKGSKIVVLTNNYLMVPGPRVTDIADQFRKSIH